MRAILPYLSHNSAHVRAMAAWGFYHLVESMGPEPIMDLCPDIGSLLLELHRFQKEQKGCEKMRTRLSPIFFDFDPLSHAAIFSLTERSVIVPTPDGNAE